MYFAIKIKDAKAHDVFSHHVNDHASRGKTMAQHRGGSGNFADDKQKASEAGKKGGQQSGGSFKDDPQKASEAGKKGGKSSNKGS
ncbi:stress-induced bacterial acidophilic repeat motif [Pantoea rodasii]|uniref:Stress-induced bacterial acidophilic repeat motif n=3 Tax=Erwiniaceae TaxID=1903409 RepID=A0A0U3U8X4_9GAMM|nr:stress-induced bacterial acidophilic repeat motif [Pantoea vagans]KHJ66283.1 stress-induced bacterial acidophilic repeat motif [Pantoea rodasii]